MSEDHPSEDPSNTAYSEAPETPRREYMAPEARDGELTNEMKMLVEGADTEPAAPTYDHYVIATTREGRVVPIWDSHHDRETFTRDEAVQTAARYNLKVPEYRYHARSIDEHAAAAADLIARTPEPVTPELHTEHDPKFTLLAALHSMATDGRTGEALPMEPSSPSEDDAPVVVDKTSGSSATAETLAPDAATAEEAIVTDPSERTSGDETPSAKAKKKASKSSKQP